MKLASREDCSGCGACMDACSCHAITISEDARGFTFPSVDPALCIDCGLCAAACPVCSGATSDSAAPEFFAARVKDTSVLTEVSSGGVFWALTISVIRSGGVVYGACRVDRDTVRHRRAETLKEAEAMRRSKYLISDMTGCYVSVRDDLDAGRRVLFSGTGCQVAALKTFLGCVRPGLVTVEVVCHGVPSSLAWRSYVTEHEAVVGKTVVDVNCRDKSGGWRDNHYRFKYGDGTASVEPSVKNRFHFSYLMGLTLRSSCIRCRYAQVPRVADLTLADYWKYAGSVVPLDDKGVSVVAVNSRRGMELWHECAGLLLVEPAAEADVRASCRHMFNAPAGNPSRDDFLAELSSAGFDSAFRRWGVPRDGRKRKSWMQRLRKRLLSAFGRLGKKGSQ